MDTTSWATFVFTSTDPCRTTLVDEAGLPVYIISTNEIDSDLITTFADAFGGVFATLEWRSYLPDRLMLGEERSKSVDKWLRTETNSRQPGQVFEHDGQKYVWKVFKQSGNKAEVLQLFAPNTPHPIASFHRGFRATVSGAPNSTPATLRIAIAAKLVQDYIVLSLLLIEKARRFGGLKRFIGFGTASTWHSATLLNFNQVGVGSYR